MNRMWNDFRETFPESEHAQDGWIGDLAHAQGVSGHNPDDTPGVSAERQDTDTKQEVRSIDKDKRLNSPRGITLEMVVQRMLKTPADLARLIYIIYNRRIWRKATGWKEEEYTGDPHDIHAHFSGDPASDENGAEWKSITSFKGVETDMDYNQSQKLTALFDALDKVKLDTDGTPDGQGTSQEFPVPMTKLIKDNHNELKSAIGAITSGGITQDMVNNAMTAALQDPAVLAALKPVIENAAFTAAQRAEDE